MKLPIRKNKRWGYYACVTWVRQDFSMLIRYIEKLQNEYGGFLPPKEMNDLKALICWTYDNVIKYFDVDELSEEKESLLHALDAYRWGQFVNLAKLLAEPYINLEE